MSRSSASRSSLIHFDAHCDTWADDTPESLNHGTMFYKAVKEGLIDPKRSVQIGIRTWNDDFMGIRILDAQWVHDNGTKAVIEEVKRVVGGHTAYLTFDIDCLDPAFAPGTGTPVAGGLSSAQAMAILRGFGELDISRHGRGRGLAALRPCRDHRAGRRAYRGRHDLPDAQPEGRGQAEALVRCGIEVLDSLERSGQARRRERRPHRLERDRRLRDRRRDQPRRPAHGAAGRATPPGSPNGRASAWRPSLRRTVRCAMSCATSARCGARPFLRRGRPRSRTLSPSERQLPVCCA